ncbi:MAG: 50S ribosomal protein L3 [Bacteroidetes bacterium]|nr:50S ribosomal protein L3 [Bacteroidota bacterium]
MIGIIGKKVGMTQISDENGKNTACTVVIGGPCHIAQIKNKEIDGYEAVQLSYEDKKEKNTNKPEQGHFKKAKITPKRKLVEFKNFLEEYEGENIKPGDSISLQDIFTEGDYIDVTGVSKGKGFQGVVKRHGFSGVGDRTHGQHNRQRSPGSIGGASYPSRVFKGIRMAGRTGGDKVTVQNLRVMKIIPESNIIVLSGAVPGSRNNYIILKK